MTDKKTKSSVLICVPPWKILCRTHVMVLVLLLLMLMIMWPVHRVDLKGLCSYQYYLILGQGSDCPTLTIH